MHETYRSQLDVIRNDIARYRDSCPPEVRSELLNRANELQNRPRPETMEEMERFIDEVAALSNDWEDAGSIS